MKKGNSLLSRITEKISQKQYQGQKRRKVHDKDAGEEKTEAEKQRVESFFGSDFAGQSK